MIRIDVLTVLPEMIVQAVGHSIIKRAVAAGVVDIRVVNLRNFALDKHQVTDDTPCGGGGGMVMKVEPIVLALENIQQDSAPNRIVLTDPQGMRFDQPTARAWAKDQHIVFICGHYEGVDERVKAHLATDVYSIGDYVLTGGELPALVMLDAVVRLQAGALGDQDAPSKDSFAEPLLEYPHYTKPRRFRNWDAPEILFSGHHAQIERWRRTQQFLRTRELRPDLWAEFVPNKLDLKLIAEMEAEERANKIRLTDPCPVFDVGGPPDGTMSDNSGGVN